MHVCKRNRGLDRDMSHNNNDGDGMIRVEDVFVFSRRLLCMPYLVRGTLPSGVWSSSTVYLCSMLTNSRQVYKYIRQRD